MQKHLRKSEIRELNEKISDWDIELDKKSEVIAEKDIFFVDKQPYFFYLEGRLVPHLKLLQENPCLPKVIVDAGAVRFMVSGADVMRPGIVSMGSFEEDALVMVVEETHNKPLAVGIALFSSVEMQVMDSGKVIKNIHYVGDEIWTKTNH